VRPVTALFQQPDSALSVVAQQMLVESSSPALVNHCYRTYQFGSALLARRGRPPDTEALFVASVLHDLGLTERYEDGSTEFQLRGAQVAFETLVDSGARPELTSSVKEAIALHLELTSADDPCPEVAGVHLGAAVDVVGLYRDELADEIVGAVLERYPRLGLKALIAEAVGEQARRKPSSRIAYYVNDLGFGELVAAAPFDS
jgi:hypothetical protein